MQLSVSCDVILDPKGVKFLKLENRWLAFVKEQTVFLCQEMKIKKNYF